MNNFSCINTILFKREIYSKFVVLNLMVAQEWFKMTQLSQILQYEFNSKGTSMLYLLK